MSRRTYRAESEIDAPASKVWEILVDLDGYGAWNPFTTRMRSTLAIGSPMDMRVRMSRWHLTLSQREIVREVTPPAGERPGRLVWGTRMPGVIAERVQTITPLGPGRCRYVTEDTLEGALVSLVHGLFGGSLDDGFSGVAQALTRRAESR